MKKFFEENGYDQDFTKRIIFSFVSFIFLIILLGCLERRKTKKNLKLKWMIKILKFIIEYKN